MFAKLINQPLFQFLLIGGFIFLLYNFTVKSNPDTDNLKTVVVDKESLITFLQYRYKAFDRIKFENKLNNMPEDELNNLINDYIREEVLYREALGFGLDKNDNVIRRRLIQKIEFINEDAVNNSLDINDGQLSDYLEKNRGSYVIDPFVTFTHVFFSNYKHGAGKANELAQNQLAMLNKNEVPFSESVKYGDRFLYNTNYVESTPDHVANHFSDEMANKLFNLNPSETNWNGPFESPYGFHLVMLTKNEKEKYPELEDVYEKVKQDLTYELSKKQKDKAISQIIDNYEIKILYKNVSNEPELSNSPGPGNQN